jgi:DNA transformation protein and related proteins
LDHEFIRELFAPFGPVTVKRMFGGAGIWSDGLMFGLVFDGAIFLKVDAASIPDFEREGSRAFVYTRAKSPGRVGRASLSYWRLPERLYDDADELAVWAARALAIAQRKKFMPRRRIGEKSKSKKKPGPKSRNKAKNMPRG